MKLLPVFFVITVMLPMFVHATKWQVPVPDSINVTSAIDYASFGERKLQLDLYQPKAEGVYPGVILVHGGGWINGTRESFQSIAVEFAQNGYVVASISYRLAGEAPFPAAVQDTKAAIRWLRSHSDVYHVDSEKIVGIGASAGGHLIAMAAATGHTKQFNGEGNHPNISSELQAVIIMGSGVDQVARVKAAKGKSCKSCIVFFGGTYDEVPQVYADGSPITHLTENMPPILMVDGEYDSPGLRYVDFRTLLDQLKIPNEFKMVPKAKHGQWFQPEFRGQYVDAYQTFLNKHLTE